MTRQIPGLALLMAGIAMAPACTRPFAAEAMLPSGWKLWKDPGPTFALAVTSDGVYAGGMEGLWLMRGDSAVEVSLPRTRNPIVNALLLDRRGRLWVGHSQGFSIREERGWQTVRESEGLPHHSIAALADGPGDSIWLGTLKGALKAPAAGPWNPRTLRLVTKKNEAVLAIASDRDGGVWLGTYGSPGGGVSRLAGGNWKHWTSKEGLPHPNVSALSLAKDGSMWAACGLTDRGGVAVFRGDKDGWQMVSRLGGNELAGPHARSLCQDSKGRLWIGSETGGLAIREAGTTVRTVTQTDGLVPGEVMAIAEGESGSMWLGTREGVLRLDSAALARLLVPGHGQAAEGE